MIKSMTGFGAGDFENDDFKVHVEVKTVNQRYLETNLHMHYSLAMFENDITKKVKSFLSRGKADINISLKDKRDADVTIQIDGSLAKAYKSALDEISELLDMPKVQSVISIANYSDVMKIDENSKDMEPGREPLMNALETALSNLVAMREAEGSNIKADLLERIDTLEGYTYELEKLAPQLVENYRQRVEKMLSELLEKDQIDPARVIQEVGLYADRINYTEETVRLRSHFDQFRKMIESPEPIGRKIDFLIQEMNREINTTASKANSAGASQLVVDVKSEIEKIREQIQNIE